MCPSVPARDERGAGAALQILDDDGGVVPVAGAGSQREQDGATSVQKLRALHPFVIAFVHRDDRLRRSAIRGHFDDRARPVLANENPVAAPVDSIWIRGVRQRHGGAAGHGNLLHFAAGPERNPSSVRGEHRLGRIQTGGALDGRRHDVAERTQIQSLVRDVDHLHAVG
jgi:hypothetical protein